MVVSSHGELVTSELITRVSSPTSSSLRITDRSFWYASPCLWNQLPSSLRQPHFGPSVSALSVHAPTTPEHLRFMFVSVSSLFFFVWFRAAD